MSGSTHRSAPAQHGPPASLGSIPSGRPTGTHWYREHGHRPADADVGCWWFAALPTDPAKGGRFDLPVPDGTCYLANSQRAAAMERVGRFTSAHLPVPAGLVVGRVVSTVETSTLPATAGNLTAARSHTHFGVTGELFTMSDYGVTQAWAAAIHDAGHDGLVYTPRFSPNGRAFAAFGPQGAHPRAVVSTRTLQEVLDRAQVTVVDTPLRSALTVVDPPSTAPA